MVFALQAARKRCAEVCNVVSALQEARKRCAEVCNVVFALQEARKRRAAGCNVVFALQEARKRRAAGYNVECTLRETRRRALKAVTWCARYSAPQGKGLGAGTRPAPSRGVDARQRLRYNEIGIFSG
ncbi:MAG: hypothetical protein C6W59_05940 [Paenibacillaceae bacterium]|nr:MAG: hypothetical protein C6W59_05940 [Paenibacillaceae bacterium]